MCSYNFIILLLCEHDDKIIQSSNCTSITFVTHTIIGVFILGYTYNYMSRCYNYIFIRIRISVFILIYAYRRN